MAMKKKAIKKSAAKKKAPAKKAVAKKKVVAKKKAAGRKAAAPERKLTAIKTRYTKTQVLNELAENTDLSKKQVIAVLDELAVLIERHIKPRSCGEFTLPGLLKVKTVKKSARKARKNVPNPFKPGELMDVAAKPASIKVKVLPLTKLKGMASK
ncbi:MAG TPA: DNA-binding protein [Gammaproteobacteria bacterium]|nr:DNA-binding protein [Gammaproteobacteria bacterium]